MRYTLQEKFWRLEHDPAWSVISLPVEPGSDAREEVLVESAGDGRLRIASSPGMLEGLAADDIIAVDAVSESGFRLLERGGNVCVHLFREQRDAIQLREVLEPRVEEIGGWLDGTMGSAGLCFTIPVATGFARIEAVFQSVVGDDWYYSNVYDLTTNEPLNWWL